MLKCQKTDDLRCMYKLLSRVPDGLRTTSSCVSQHLREEGKSLVTEDEGGANALNFVQVTKFGHKVQGNDPHSPIFPCTESLGSEGPVRHFPIQVIRRRQDLQTNDIVGFRILSELESQIARVFVALYRRQAEERCQGHDGTRNRKRFGQDDGSLPLPPRKGRL